MSAPAAELESTVRLLVRDVTVTVGAQYARMVHEFAADIARLDLDDPSAKCVDDVQQYLQDMYVDTTWPACTRHPNHPMQHEAGAWCCPRDHVALFRLGELPPRAGGHDPARAPSERAPPHH